MREYNYPSFPEPYKHGHMSTKNEPFVRQESNELMQAGRIGWQLLRELEQLGFTGG